VRPSAPRSWKRCFLCSFPAKMFLSFGSYKIGERQFVAFLRKSFSQQEYTSGKYVKLGIKSNYINL
jgi:hypothetical protein